MIQCTMSDKAREIEPKLREYYDDDDFVQGVVVNAKTDENLSEIERFIAYAEKNDEEITSDHIIAMALMLGRK